MLVGPLLRRVGLVSLHTRDLIHRKMLRPVDIHLQDQPIQNTAVCIVPRLW